VGVVAVGLVVVVPGGCVRMDTGSCLCCNMSALLCCFPLTHSSTHLLLLLPPSPTPTGRSVGGGACALRWRGRCLSSPTCCCWMSPRERCCCGLLVGENWEGALGGLASHLQGILLPVYITFIAYFPRTHPTPHPPNRPPHGSLTAATTWICLRCCGWRTI